MKHASKTEGRVDTAEQEEELIDRPITLMMFIKPWAHFFRRRRGRAWRLAGLALALLISLSFMTSTGI
jgi:hypothetical protein